MKRRLFISLLGGTAAWPLTARAQQTVGKFPKIGFLQGSQNENVAAFIQALQAAGYTDGQNVRIETRIYGTMLDRLGEFASELVDLQCKVILAAAPYAIRAAAGATAPASPSVAQINMSATPSAGRGRALKPRPADTRHRLVPNYRNPNSIDLPPGVTLSRKDAKSRTGGRKLVMLMARPIPRADLKKQESRWACRRSGSSHVSVGLTGLLNPT
ncbi:MAG TPA: hypothetical protein VM910_25925 [Bradyrhizobium sp.]|nr:hypothetical protein [Bradyrhizobium sp.]